MSSDTRELRQALEAAQAEARAAREHETERKRLERELEQARRELADNKIVLEELTRQAGALAGRAKDDAALQSELRRLRAEAEVGLSARQRYERSRAGKMRREPGQLSPWGAGLSARWFVGLIGAALGFVGLVEGRLHPVVALSFGAALALWAGVSGPEN